MMGNSEEATKETVWTIEPARDLSREELLNFQLQIKAMENAQAADVPPPISDPLLYSLWIFDHLHPALQGLTLVLFFFIVWPVIRDRVIGRWFPKLKNGSSNGHLLLVNGKQFDPDRCVVSLRGMEKKTGETTKWLGKLDGRLNKIEGLLEGKFGLGD